MGAIQTTYATAPAVAFAGLLADDSENDVMTMKNADTVSMPFGVPVAFKTAGPTSDRDSLMPNATTDKYVGILVHSHDFERTFTLPDGTTAGELDAVGVVAGAEIAVCWRGACWVKVQTAVAPGDRLFVAYNNTGATYTAAGQVGNAAEGGHTNDLTNIARFTSTASAGGFAKLQFDFSQKP